MECLLPYLCMVTVPHIMVRLKRMLDYRGVGLARYHCIMSLICSYKSVMILIPYNIICTYTSSRLLLSLLVISIVVMPNEHGSSVLFLSTKS